MNKYVKKLLTFSIAILIIGIISYRIYPNPYKDWVKQVAAHYEVDPLLIYAIIQTESRFKEDALSHSGAKGLMQIMNITGQWGADENNLENFTTDDLFNPFINIQIGTWYISRLINQYNGNLDVALAAYNAGSGNVAKWRANTNYSADGTTLHTIPFKETEQYISRVNFHYKVYKILYPNY